MPTEDKQNKKGIFGRICEFLKGFEGSGCACNCLKTAWEKSAQEVAQKNNQGNSEPKYNDQGRTTTERCEMSGCRRKIQ